MADRRPRPHQADVDLLRAAGEAIYGELWQRALARGLEDWRPDGRRSPIDDRAVRRWAAGAKPVPSWVWLALSGLVQAELSSFADRRRELSALKRRLGEQFVVAERA